MMQLNKIYNGDSALLLKELADNSVDMVITSPPYDNMREYSGSTWNFDVFKEIAQELKRIIKWGGLLFG